MTISPKRLERAMSAAMQADPELLHRQGDTDIFAILDDLAESAIADRLMSELASERAKRFDTRAAKARDIIMAILEALGLDRLERAAYTATLADAPVSARIIDETKLPPKYWNKPTPNRRLIAASLGDGDEVPGAELNNRARILRLLTR